MTQNHRKISLFSKATKKKLKVALAGFFGPLLLRTLSSTIRWQRNELPALREKLPVIAAFWHGRQLMLAPLVQRSLPGQPVAVLISAHADGQMIARAIEKLGLQSIAGSSTRGGVEAFRRLLSALKNGISVGITPDGPKGPAYQVKPGVIRLAQLAQRPIYPVTYAVQRQWTFRSWDRMVLPKPFTRGVCVVGEPLQFSPDKDEAACALQLEQALSHLQTIADGGL